MSELDVATGVIFGVASSLSRLFMYLISETGFATLEGHRRSLLFKVTLLMLIIDTMYSPVCQTNTGLNLGVTMGSWLRPWVKATHHQYELHISCNP